MVSHSAARVGIAAADWNDLRSALSAIPPSCSRDEWVRTGFALKAQGEASGQAERAHEMWRAWSAGDPTKYPGDKAVAQQWGSFQSDKENAVGPASIFHLAQRYGWTRPQLDVSEMFTASAAAPSNEPPPHAMSIVFADALPEAFQPPDELIQGLLPWQPFPRFAVRQGNRRGFCRGLVMCNRCIHVHALCAQRANKCACSAPPYRGCTHAHAQH
ncbi:PriCT-2 domain-containing protein [Hydrogenophaga sp.]|uniref:PriCT-2 domain-containing protein n=1 Tax=Hydrogenophaga sp. TaxID=1904254 RepID=UPI0034507667|nr:PriCT-2 domain-containing protein [Hydrogenophaga sp.]